jgi:hypothetical protein
MREYAIKKSFMVSRAIGVQRSVLVLFGARINVCIAGEQLKILRDAD